RFDFFYCLARRMGVVHYCAGKGPEPGISVLPPTLELHDAEGCKVCVAEGERSHQKPSAPAQLRLYRLLWTGDGLRAVVGLPCNFCRTLRAKLRRGAFISSPQTPNLSALSTHTPFVSPVRLAASCSGGWRLTSTPSYSQTTSGKPHRFHHMNIDTCLLLLLLLLPRKHAKRKHVPPRWNLGQWNLHWALRQSDTRAQRGDRRHSRDGGPFANTQHLEPYASAGAKPEGRMGLWDIWVTYWIPGQLNHSIAAADKAGIAAPEIALTAHSRSPSDSSQASPAAI
ncbi:hypothetical protein B0T25DRAFT_560862, partial [Lasiosphaeria hispida]